jgi:hypothetical protein
VLPDHGTFRQSLGARRTDEIGVLQLLELAGEVARRSSAPDRGELTSVRAEAGYRFNEQALMAAGYTLFGFSGLGLPTSGRERDDRFYLRAELAY